MEESIFLSSDSNPSSPPLLPPDLDQDLDIPKAKLSDICGSKNSGVQSNVTPLPTTTSSWLCNAEPMPSTSKYIPSFELPGVASKDSRSDDKPDFTQSSASWKFFRPSSSGVTSKIEAVADLNVHQLSDSDAGLSDFSSDYENEPFEKKGDNAVSRNCRTNYLNETNEAVACTSWKPFPSCSGVTRTTDAVPDLNTHLSDSHENGDSGNESFTKKEDHAESKNSQPYLNQTNDAEETSKWQSLLDEDTDPPSSRSSSTLPPDQVTDTLLPYAINCSIIPPLRPPDSDLQSSDSASTLPPESVHPPDQVPAALLPSISNCSTIPPHRSPESVLQSSDSASTLPPESVNPTYLSRSSKFEKKPSFHDIPDGEGSSTIENVPTVFPNVVDYEEFKFSFSHDISLSKEEPEDPPGTSSSILPPLLDDKSSKLLATHSEPTFSNSYHISEFVSQLGNNSQPLTSASSQPLPSQKGSRGNATDVLERKRLKELNIKKKFERAAAAERVRRMKPGECMKYITVVLDQNIVSEYPWALTVVEILQMASIKCSVEVATDPCTVKWTREQADSLVPQQEKHILFLWSTEKLLTSIQYGTLSDSFAEFKKKYANYKLYLCVHGLQNYYRKFHRAKQRQNNSSSPPKRKRKSNYEIVPDQLEMELIALQIKFGISHKTLNSAQDTACFLQSITKSVAEMPFKLEKEMVEMERNWYAKGDSKKCVRVDKDFNGLRQLWLQQLSQFNLSSHDIAKSIAELYPTPLILYHAYRQCSNPKEKETMLQDIVVKRGPGDGGRRLGPELSRKISIMFCQDEDISLD